jgi:hypothetical protein
MANLNIQVDLTRLPGARVMDIQGNKQLRRCVVIPIDREVGTVIDGYMGKAQDGVSPEFKFFDDIKLNMVAVEYRTHRHGISHGLKPQFSKERVERMTEQQMYDVPWIGTVKPWNIKEEKKADEIGDLPEDDNENDW